MSSTVVVSIALHGLIALVPVQEASDGVALTPSANASHMAALLVDAHDPPALLQSTAASIAESRALSCITRHDALLDFTIPDSSTADCLRQQPICKLLPSPPEGSPQPRHCQCQPAGKRFWLTPASAPPVHAFIRHPISEMPQDHGKPDFSYFPNLSQLGYKLDRNALSSAPGALLARMVFPFDKLTTCNLAVRRGEDQRDYVHSFGFRSHNGTPTPQQPHQAVAQRLVASMTYQLAQGDHLQLNMSDLSDSKGEHTASFQLAQTGTVEIDLSNERPGIMDFDDPCNDGIGRDFALFYRLVSPAQPDWKLVPLPHLVPAVAKLAADVEDMDCSMGPGPHKGMVSRPICAMATFVE